MTFEQDALDTVVKKSSLIITVARLIKPVNKTSLFQCHPMQQILRLPGGGRGDSKDNSLFCLNCMQKKKKKIHIVLLQNAFFFLFFSGEFLAFHHLQPFSSTAPSPHRNARYVIAQQLNLCSYVTAQGYERCRTTLTS